MNYKRICLSLRIVPVILAVIFTFTRSGDAREILFYVSADGNDASGGRTLETPFATIARAQQAVRELKTGGSLTQPVTVYVRGGIYELGEPLRFHPEDSGTPEYPVTYMSYPGETAVLSGGMKITGFREESKNVWKAEIPGVRDGERYFRQLFVNGQRRQRSRIPIKVFSM